MTMMSIFAKAHLMLYIAHLVRPGRRVANVEGLEQKRARTAERSRLAAPTRRAANSSFLFGYSSSLRLSNVIRTALPGRVEVSRSRDGNNVLKCSLEPIAFSAQTQREMDGSLNGGTHAWRGQFKKGAKSFSHPCAREKWRSAVCLASCCGRSSTVVC